jgi:glycosyltransferase involved in cell wall biosynthesis
LRSDIKEMKKTIIHIIDNLARGGAETMLVKVIKNLPEYNNIIVTLYPENEFGEQIECDKTFCLNIRSCLYSPLAALKLRRIIKDNNAAIVHSHLFWATVVARLGTPKETALVSTIHTFPADAIQYSTWHMRVIEKLTYKIRKGIIVTVAKGAQDGYFDLLKTKPYKAYTLHTFVDTAIFNVAGSNTKKEEKENFRLVTVGNLKEAKNYFFLLEVFKELKGQNISLDIYGKGLLDEAMQKTIDEHQLNVTLKGQAQDIQQKLKQYDLFVMSSLYEGFSLSVLEAMAMAMPMLLSDIVSFREQCEDTAAYYNLKDSKDFITKLLVLMNDRQQLKTLGSAAQKRVLANFTLEKHLQQLKSIYAEALVLS